MKSWIIAAVAAAMATCAAAQQPAGSKQIRLHTRDGASLVVGEVLFQPQAGGRTGFEVKLAREDMTDYFLSMREFKCLKGEGEVLCAVPYPYKQPGSIAAGDLAWLEHSLLWLRNKPGDHGAKLSEGVYFALTPTATGGFEGRLQSVDLQVIGAPLDNPAPPYKPALRGDVNVATRWFQRLSID